MKTPRSYPAKPLYSLDEQLRRCVRQQERDWLQKGLTVEGDLDQVDYYGNEELVEHIWSNLLSNAIRFTPAGGQITVVLRQSERRDHCLRLRHGYRHGRGDAAAHF